MPILLGLEFLSSARVKHCLAQLFIYNKKDDKSRSIIHKKKENDKSIFLP
jgi:hypothetical protein